MEIDGGCLNLQAGQGLHVPSGAVHRFFNPHDRDVVFLVVSCPSTSRDRIEQPQASPKAASA